jgi:hypothetical protein
VRRAAGVPRSVPELLKPMALGGGEPPALCRRDARRAQGPPLATPDRKPPESTGACRIRHPPPAIPAGVRRRKRRR